MVEKMDTPLITDEEDPKWELLGKIPKWDKGISCPYFHILYAHINYFALPSPPLNSE